MSLWSAIGSFASSILGGVGQSAVNYVSSSKGMKDQYNYNSALQKQTFGYNAALQKQAQNWSTGMASTAHQLEVNDLRKAGLNPILSATGGSGAVAPGASGGSVGSSSVGIPDYGLGEGIGTALQFRQQKNQDKQTHYDVELKKAQKGLVNEQEHNAYQEGMNLFDQRNYIRQQTEDLKNQIKNRDAMTAANVKRLETMNTADLMNAITNQTVGSAKSYRDRQEGYYAGAKDWRSYPLWMGDNFRRTFLNKSGLWK